MQRQRFIATPRIFWQEGKLIICKQMNGLYHLCIDKGKEFHYTGITSKDIEELKVKAQTYGNE